MIIWEVNRWKSLLFIIVIAFLWELHVEKRFVDLWYYPKVVICGDKNEKIKNNTC
jgi:hypothetical protein